MKASSAAVIYKWSFLSGLHNEFRKLSGTINTYYISPGSLRSLIGSAGDRFGDARKMELAQEQNPELPEGGADLNREARDLQKDSFPQLPSQGPNPSLQRPIPGGMDMASLDFS